MTPVCSSFRIVDTLEDSGLVPSVKPHPPKSLPVNLNPTIVREVSLLRMLSLNLDQIGLPLSLPPVPCARLRPSLSGPVSLKRRTKKFYPLITQRRIDVPFQ